MKKVDFFKVFVFVLSENFSLLCRPLVFCRSSLFCVEIVFSKDNFLLVFFFKVRISHIYIYIYFVEIVSLRDDFSLDFILFFLIIFLEIISSRDYFSLLNFLNVVS